MSFVFIVSLLQHTIYEIKQKWDDFMYKAFLK